MPHLQTTQENNFTQLTIPLRSDILWKLIALITRNIFLDFFISISDCGRGREKSSEEYHDEEVARSDHNHRWRSKDVDGSNSKSAEEFTKLNEIFDKLTNAVKPEARQDFDDLDLPTKINFKRNHPTPHHHFHTQFGDNYISLTFGDAYEYLIGNSRRMRGKRRRILHPREVGVSS